MSEIIIDMENQISAEKENIGPIELITNVDVAIRKCELLIDVLNHKGRSNVAALDPRKMLTELKGLKENIDEDETLERIIRENHKLASKENAAAIERIRGYYDRLQNISKELTKFFADKLKEAEQMRKLLKALLANIYSQIEALEKEVVELGEQVEEAKTQISQNNDQIQILDKDLFVVDTGINDNLIELGGIFVRGVNDAFEKRGMAPPPSKKTQESFEKYVQNNQEQIATNEEGWHQDCAKQCLLEAASELPPEERQGLVEELQKQVLGNDEQFQKVFGELGRLMKAKARLEKERAGLLESNQELETKIEGLEELIAQKNARIGALSKEAVGLEQQLEDMKSPENTAEGISHNQEEKISTTTPTLN